MTPNWRADNGPLLVEFGSSIPSPTKKLSWTPLTKLSGSAHAKCHNRFINEAIFLYRTSDDVLCLGQRFKIPTAAFYNFLPGQTSCSSELEIIQLLMLIVKYYIYMCRNNKCAMNFKVYKLYLRTFYQTQREIALSNNDIDNFQKKWYRYQWLIV